MIIAVTGASGSIGRELVPFLEGLGHTIIKISSSKQSESNFSYTFEQLTNQEIKSSVDLFIHLASLNSNVDSENLNEEVGLTKTVLLSLPSLGCKKLIFFSTAKVYGDNSFLDKIFTETSDLNPICNYSNAKKICEELILQETSIHSLIFRMPPLINFSTSNLGKLLNLSKKNIPIPTFKDGFANKRSFISMINIQSVMTFVTENINFIHHHKIYNIADDGIVSLNDLLKNNNRNFLIVLPNFLFTLLQKISFARNILKKLFGNFVLDNSKLKSEMGVTLISTKDALSSTNS
jgi:nucleoside-diphosphate-sugar epimerase